METSRLTNPDPRQIRRAIDQALHLTTIGDDPPTARREFFSAQGAVDSPESLAEEIGRTTEGVVVLSGHLVVRGGRRDGSGAIALLASWWTALDGSKLVLLAGCFVEFHRGQSHEHLGAICGRLKPRDVIRGYRMNAREGLVGSLSRTPFAWLSRMPAIDPTREALELAALYGDLAAMDALHDYKLEHGLA